MGKISDSYLPATVICPRHVHIILVWDFGQISSNFDSHRAVSGGNFSKYQWIFLNLSMCTDIDEDLQTWYVHLIF